MPDAAIRCSQQDLDAANQIRDRVLAVSDGRVSRILFHGSRVNGRARPSSDFDILVIMRDPVDDWVAESMKLTDLFNDFPWPVDVQVYGEADFDASSTVPGTLAHPASTRGVTLYEREIARGAGIARARLRGGGARRLGMG